MRLATYGTLMSGCPAHGLMEEGIKTKLLGEYKVSGKIYDLGAFPGFKESENGAVTVEVYEVISDEKNLIQSLDSFEGFTPGSPHSFYIRKKVKLLDDGREVSIYVFNRDVNESSLIESGDWKSHAGITTRHIQFES